MGRKIKRLASAIRSTLGQALLTSMSDPRFDPTRTSITRVEVAGDFRTATVYISVSGDEKLQRLALASLRHAAGYLQDKLNERIQLRHTPKLSFEIDTLYEKTMQTLNILAEVSKEIRQKDEAQDSVNQQD